MKKRTGFGSGVIGWLVCLAMGLAPGAAAGGAPPLVDTAWLAGHLGRKGLVVMDVRTEANYAFAHIPGAVSVPYGEMEPPGDEGELLMVPEGELTDLLQEAGVNRDSHVVVYAHGNTVSDASKAGAVYWILKANGLERVSMLNGGFTKWTFEGRKVVKDEPAPRRGDFVARRDPRAIAGLDDVRRAIADPRTFLVDARNPDQHFGHTKRADVACYGHIPSSVSLPAAYLTNAGRNRAPATLKDEAVLEALARGVGLPADKGAGIIVYCNTAQFAGIDYLVLHDVLGYENVRVYDGSMLEYCRRRGDLPLERFSWGRPSGRAAGPDDDRRRRR
ncbi:sulfurtransferase [Dissulfurirhabdus thermomarina]|uniref:Sulfurtransferase n=1 Tax=Dissulfurirhabdus thermomarina TaxID=1765737 RepID=A0A6N9TJY6_DISTH|nr:rhodanese-like domain-containing protein [Dissulfurirhabdus thermomarina]NDY41389.1 sulfurtransferase [Dissulfurirhabdus thermomarina]NMX23595.1 sulfurtransferase [Dissulfurirhabdus thermomarina]